MGWEVEQEKNQTVNKERFQGVCFEICMLFTRERNKKYDVSTFDASLNKRCIIIDTRKSGIPMFLLDSYFVMRGEYTLSHNMRMKGTSILQTLTSTSFSYRLNFEKYSKKY